MSVPAPNLLKLALAAAAGLAIVLTTPAGAVGLDVRCFTANAGERKTSLGVHQWTVRQETHWCAERRDGRRRIVSVDRRASFRTGTNWRLISRSGGVRRDGARALAESRFHFRLRYPYFQQNCYPRIEIAIWPSGEYERAVKTGC